MSVENKINTKNELNTDSNNLIDSLKNWDINQALKNLWDKIKNSIEFSKEFLSDLFKTREFSKNLSKEDTQKICNDCFDKFLSNKV